MISGAGSPFSVVIIQASPIQAILRCKKGEEEEDAV